MCCREGDHAGKRMTDRFTATVSGSTGAVAAESHLSSERAQWLVAGVMGVGMATEMVVAPGSNFLFGVPGLFATVRERAAQYAYTPHCFTVPHAWRERTHWRRTGRSDLRCAVAWWDTRRVSCR